MNGKEAIFIKVLSVLSEYYAFLLENSEESLQEEAEIQAVCDGVFGHLGKIDGQRMKGLGLLSAEFKSIIIEYAQKFNLKISFHGPLKPPYAGLSGRCEVPDPNRPALYGCWKAFFGACLSAYGLSAVEVLPENSKQGAADFRIAKYVGRLGQESDNSNSSSIRDYVHKLNNLLGGAMSFASLIKGEDKTEENARQVIQSIREAVALTKTTFPPKKD